MLFLFGFLDLRPDDAPSLEAQYQPTAKAPTKKLGKLLAHTVV
jgi:hypothetical protein